ncbi:MAG: hypothetical protein AB8C46_21510 [Burkholderiaceae bacterium]
MNQIISLEPPDGDFVAYIDAIVGPPPEDPETAARDISAQLALRSKDNIDTMNAISPNQQAEAAQAAASRGPLGTAGGNLAAIANQALRPNARGELDGLPDMADAMANVRRQGRSAISALLSGVARLGIFAGVAWIFAAVALADMFPGMNPAVGVGIIFVSIVLSNMAASK